MKIAVVGSRDFKDAYVRVNKCLIKVRKLYGNKIIILTGGGGQVDHCVITISVILGLRLYVIPAQWEKYGPSAGPRRNEEIVKQSDLVYAFWDGKSRGTSNVISLCKKHGKELIIRRELAGPIT